MLARFASLKTTCRVLLGRELTGIQTMVEYVLAFAFAYAAYVAEEAL